MKARPASMLVLALLATAIGCSPAPEATPVAASPTPRAFGPQKESPDRDSILRVLLSATDYRLSRHESCKSAATQPDDQTIGDYLAGFMAEQGSGSNSISARCPSSGSSSHQCEVYLQHADGDDQWAWGVGFQIAIKDGALVDGSVRCLGAG
jgi:hypothetical protein